MARVVQEIDGDLPVRVISGGLNTHSETEDQILYHSLGKSIRLRGREVQTDDGGIRQR